MRNWLKRLLPWLEKDVLIGRWSNEDGSGISMMFSAAVIFKHYGTGQFVGNGTRPFPENKEEEEYTYDIPFTWQRINENTIAITTEEGQKTLQYSLVRHKGYTWGHMLTKTGGDSGWFYGSHFRF